MMIWGLLSLLQLVFLPGFLFLRISALKITFIQRIIFSFALSLVLNYVAVFFLTSLSWYVRPVVLGIFSVEVFLLAYFYRRHLWSFMAARAWANAAGAFPAAQEKISSFVKSASFGSLAPEKRENRYISWTIYGINLVLLCAGLGVLGWACNLAVNNVGTIFMEWDPVVSWNRWAVDWSHNRFPLNTYSYYPQLIPANWSVSYVFMDYPLQFFPKAIMPLFLVFTLALMLDLAFLNKSATYLVGMVPATFFFETAIGKAIGEGYADTAVAFMGFLTICCLIYANRSDDPETTKKYVLLGGIFAAGALVTKQSGVYVLACFAVLVAARLLRFRRTLRRRDVLAVIFSLVAPIAVIDGPFFLWRAYEISRGINPPPSVNFYEVWNSAKLGATYAERLAGGYTKFILLFEVLRAQKEVFQSVAIGLVFGGLILAFTDRMWGRIAALMGLGWWFLWSLFLSYDLRNLTIAFPFLGLAIGIGLARIPVLGRLRGVTILGIVVIGLGALGHSLNGGVLIDRHVALQKKIGHAQLNELLLDYRNKSGIDKKILSNYQMLNYVPGFEGSLHIQYFENSQIDPGNELAAFRENINRPEVGFVLFPIWAGGPVLDEVNLKIASGGLQEIFREQGYIFSRINRDSEGRIVSVASLHLDFISRNLRLNGLRALEGPYPQWNLPQVRWAVKPSVAMDFRCTGGNPDNRIEVKISFIPWARASADMVVKLNGREIATYRVDNTKGWRDEVLSLQPRDGGNHLEIIFPGSPPPDGLFMLFRKFSLAGNFSL